MNRCNGLAARAALLALAAGLAGTPAVDTQTPARSAAQTPAAVRNAGLVVRGGRIVTVDDSRPEAQAIAGRNDTIVGNRQ